MKSQMVDTGSWGGGRRKLQAGPLCAAVYLATVSAQATVARRQSPHMTAMGIRPPIVMSDRPVFCTTGAAGSDIVLSHSFILSPFHSSLYQTMRYLDVGGATKSIK